jgi:CheY-like chemotaxis protein
MQLEKDYDAASIGIGPSGPAPVLDAAASGITTPARLLLVDDTPANLKILARLLEKRGYQTELAEDGLQAIEQFRTRDYDAILMDLQMPGLDGFGATQAIRAMDERRQIPIIALTAHVVDGTRERCLAVGMSDYLAKPIDIGLLTATIEAQLRGGSR